MSETETTYKNGIAEEANRLTRQAAEAVTVEALAALDENRGILIIQRRLEILELARKGSIARTFPRDWVLFKADSGIYAYLQDSGCERIKDIWGINVEHVSEFKTEEQADGTIVYLIWGDGSCNLTRSRVEHVLGSRDIGSMAMGRSDVPLSQLKIDTMKAARSNLDGSIIRHLAGLANVPIEEINRIMSRPENEQSGFNLGRGFGSQADRQSQEADKGDYGTPPNCEKCGKPLKLLQGKYGPFWGGHRDCGIKPVSAKKVNGKPTSQGDTQGSSQDVPSLKNSLISLISRLPTKEERDSYKTSVLKAETVEQLKQIEKTMREAIGEPF